QPDAVVDAALALHPPADAAFDEQVRRALLQHASADGGLDLLAAAAFEHHGLDAVQVQQMREQQARRPGPDDAHLRTHGRTPTARDRLPARAWPGPPGFRPHGWRPRDRGTGSRGSPSLAVLPR